MLTPLEVEALRLSLLISCGPSSAGCRSLSRWHGCWRAGVSRPRPARRHRPSAPGPAAGGGRLWPAASCSAAGASSAPGCMTRSASPWRSPGRAPHWPRRSWRLPLMVRAIRLSIESVDRGLEAAAATLGASRVGVFFTITLPLAAPGVLAGAVLGFARSLGEFGATITFVSSIPGPDPHLADRDLRTDPGSGRRSRRRAPMRDRRGPVAGRAARLRDSGPPPRPTTAGPRRCLRSNFARGWAIFTLDAAFATGDAPVTALFGRSGAGKSSIIAAVAGLLRPDAGRIVLDGGALFNSTRHTAIAAAAPPRRRRVPGCPAVSAYERARQSPLWLAARAAAAAPGTSTR